ncbi:MAG: Phosphoenolpyruvate synthase, partial [uncultured Chloroflexia bacterium]
MNHHQPNAPLTINLADVNRDSLALVGGKGANLAELMAAGFPVPCGFCVTTRAFECFIAQTANAERLYTKLDGLTAQNLTDVQAAGNEVRARLRQTEMPRAVAQSILHIWQELGRDHAYSVRSSATAEDLPYASFAGQQDTYLNVRGAAALLEAVQNCWVSLFTDRAILYRLQHGFAHREVRLAVIVQRMVESEVAGIMFTADPVTGNRHIISIDASYGLGEATVSGIVSADLFQVDTRKNAITKRQIADKHLRIQALPQGGVEQVALRGAERTRPALDDEQVLALACIGQQIATHYHEPQDIEWAFARGQWFILQARPITSLFPLPQPVPDDKTLHVYLSFSHFQVMTDPMPPLVTSLWRVIVPFGAPQGTLENPYLTAAAGRIYLDISLAVRHRLLRHVLPRVLRNADILAAQALDEMIASGTFVNGPSVRPTSIARFVAPLVAGVLAQVLWKQPQGATERGQLLMDRYVARTEAQLRATPQGSARLVLAVGIMRDTFTHIVKAWFAVPLTGMLANALLIRVARSFANADDVTALGRGWRGNVTTDMDLAVGDLADLIRQSPPLLAHLSQTGINPSSLVETAREFEGGAAFV